MSKYNWKNIKGVGLGIVAFEATEHLANIISEFRDSFDYVTIGLQRKSYHGDPIDNTDLEEIFRLRDEDHLVDTVLEINLDTNKEPRVQETDKRNLLIQDIEDHGCSHALIIDSDEFYTKNSILKALVEIDKNDYEITYCQYINYYHDYKHFLVYPFADGMYVPFITKTKYRFSFESVDFPKPSDPTRRYVRPFDRYLLHDCNTKVGIVYGYDIDKKWEEIVNDALDKDMTPSVDKLIENVKKVITRKIKESIGNKSLIPTDIDQKVEEKVRTSLSKNYTVGYHIFEWNTVKMHHLSCIRADIRKKFNDWSSKRCFENYNDMIDVAIDAYNKFDPESQEQQTVSLLFGTPGNKVYVKPLQKQFIFPKYDIMSRYKPVKRYKKIAIMNLSTTNSDVDLFKKLDSTCRDTWAKDVVNGKFENIDYWTVIDSKEKSRINKNNKIIYVQTNPNEDNIQELLNRWLVAYEMLEKAGYKYEWVLRTNTSTWCNIDLINEFLAYETDDSQTYSFKLFSAFWSTFNLYMSGAGMLWSTRNIPILKKLVDDTPKEELDKALDDVMMCALWLKRSIKLGFSNKYYNMHSLEGMHLQDLEKNTDYESIDFLSPMIQIKTFQGLDGSYASGQKHEIRLDNDIVKMNKVNDLWNSKKQDIDIEQLAKDLRNNLDKTINVITYSKKEWLTEGYLTSEQKESVAFSNTQPYNEETMTWLENRAIECGYKH